MTREGGKSEGKERKIDKRMEVELAPVPVLKACVSTLVQPNRAEPNQRAARLKYLFGPSTWSKIRAEGTEPVLGWR